MRWTAEAVASLSDELLVVRRVDQELPSPPPGVPIDVRDAERPSHFFNDSDIGGRISAFLFGWDLTVNYLYHYVDIPVLFANVDATSGVPTLVVTPRYERV